MAGLNQLQLVQEAINIQDESKKKHPLDRIDDFVKTVKYSMGLFKSFPSFQVFIERRMMDIIEIYSNNHLVSEIETIRIIDQLVKL